MQVWDVSAELPMYGVRLVISPANGDDSFGSRRRYKTLTAWTRHHQNNSKCLETPALDGMRYVGTRMIVHTHVHAHKLATVTAK